MSDLTFLTEEQCFGDNQLDIFKKRGNRAALTDFAILLGAFVSKYRINNDSSLEGRTGYYWTKSDDSNNDVLVVKYNASRNPIYVNIRNVGARLALPLLDASIIPTNGENGKRSKDGILEVEYGYNRNSYVRVKANIFYVSKVQLSNGEKYKNCDYVWVEVLPVKWLVDEDSLMMITEKIISAGVRFNDKINYYTEDFDKTEIKKFMDEHLWRDMFQYREKQTTVSAPHARTRKPYDFDFTEASEEDIIKGALKSNVAIFLHGKPGCGKSDRVKQLDPDFIELNLSHLDPELLDGLAGEKDGKEVHIKPPWLEELEEKCKDEPDKIHILFLEELTNASAVMQSKAYGIALDKKVAGRWKLPENARVVAAGNELEDSLVANEMAEPLYDRFAHVNIETTKENWLEWAVTPESYYSRLDYVKEENKRPKIHPAIYGYISLKGNEALRTPYNKEHPQPHADPRRWKMASDMLYASNNPSTLKAIVGEDLTRDFIAFCQIPTISIEDVLKGNYTEEEIKEMDIGMRLATISGLVAVDTENMPKIREFAKKLGPEMCKKFEIQWTHGDEDRLEQLQELIMQEKKEIDR